MPTYQVMPDLSPEDYAELKADIAARGVQVPVEYDEDGNILDGHHRVRACTELGIADWPRIVRTGMTEDQKREHARKLNMARRHLTREQRQELIRQQLRETPEKSDRRIAAGLGVSDKTVGVQRQEMERRAEIPHMEKVVDSLGREQPRQVERKTPCEQCKSAHPWCDDCCSTCKDKCNIQQSCRLQPSAPITPYDPTKTENEKSAHTIQPDPQDTHEIIRQNTDKAFSTIYDRVIYLSDDYANIAQCLLENPNRTREDTAQKLSECIERLQQIKIAVLKTSTLRAVK